MFSVLLALPLAAVAQMYGSPGAMSVSSLEGHSAPGTCGGNVNMHGNPAIRLPKEWMNGNAKCGATMTIYFTPRQDGGLSAPAQLTSAVGTVADTCTECNSWSVTVDKKLYGDIYPGGKGDTPTWGPAFVFE